MERVRVQWRRDGEIVPALRDGDVLGWNYVAPDTGTVGRSFLLLDTGVKLTIPPIWIGRGDPIWYVDLALVTRQMTCIASWTSISMRSCRPMADRIARSTWTSWPTRSRLASSPSRRRWMACGGGSDFSTPTFTGSARKTCGPVGATFHRPPSRTWRAWNRMPSSRSDSPTEDREAVTCWGADLNRCLSRGLPSGDPVTCHPRRRGRRATPGG